MELPPGHPLRETELVGLIGVGRTPLREAIQRLSTEKLVVAWPRQTPYVAPIHAHELAQIVEMRFILEIPVARLAAARATDAERASLESICRQFQRAVAAGDSQAVVETDERFHNTAAIAARNSYLLDASRQLTSFNGRLWRLSASCSKDDPELQHSHNALTAAIMAAEPDQAAAAAAEHIEFFQSRLRRLLENSSRMPALSGLAHSPW